MIEIRIRPECEADYAAILAITQRAFAPMPFADGDEQELISKFREASALALSLVAEKDGVVGFHPVFYG